MTLGQTSLQVSSKSVHRFSRYCDKQKSTVNRCNGDKEKCHLLVLNITYSFIFDIQIHISVLIGDVPKGFNSIWYVCAETSLFIWKRGKIEDQQTTCLFQQHSKGQSCSSHTRHTHSSTTRTERELSSAYLNVIPRSQNNVLSTNVVW